MAPWAPRYTNSEGKRAPKEFLVKHSAKSCLKRLFWPVFFHNFLHAAQKISSKKSFYSDCECSEKSLVDLKKGR